MEMNQYKGIHIIIFFIMAFPLEVITSTLICSSLNNLLLQTMEQLNDDTNGYWEGRYSDITCIQNSVWKQI